MLTRKQHELLTFIDAHLKSTGFSPSFEEMKDALSLKSKSGIHRLISALEERGFLRRHHHRARALEVIRLPDDRLAQERLAQERLVQERGAQEHGAQEHGAQERGGRERAAQERGTQEGGAQERPDQDPPARAAAGAQFSPNVIRGDFTGRLPGVRSANDAVAVQLPLYGRIAAGLPIEALRDQGAQIEVPVAMLGNGDHYALEVAGDSMVDAGILDGDTVIIRQGDTAESGQIVVAMIDETEVTLKRLRRRGQSIALEPANPRHEIRIFPADRVRVQGRLVALLRKY